MTLSMKEKKILYAYGCPSHHNTVTRLKWLTALTVDPEAKRRMLGLARKVETEVGESWYEDFYHHGRPLPYAIQPVALIRQRWELRKQFFLFCPCIFSNLYKLFDR